MSEENQEVPVKYTVMRGFPFPLRPDCICTLWLPLDLTHAEAERLCGYIKILPIDQKDSKNEHIGH